MVLSLFSPDKKKDADVVSQVSVGGLSRPTELRAWVRRCGEGDLPTALQVAIHMRAATRCEKRVDGKVHLRVSTRGDVTKGWVGINRAAGAQVCVTRTQMFVHLLVTSRDHFLAASHLKCRLSACHLFRDSALNSAFSGIRLKNWTNICR